MLCSVEPGKPFAQTDPPHVCRDWPFNLRLSAYHGYRVCCRLPRCSIACYANWRRKEAAILSRFLTHHLPEDMTAYRGNLTLPNYATVDDHRRTRKRFLELLARWQNSTGYTVRISATAHVTSPTAQHYDFVAYSDAPHKTLRRTIRDAWKLGGGDSYSIKPIDSTDDELHNAARYTMKDVSVSRFVHLPARNGLRLRWGHRHFYTPTRKDLWEECKRAWFRVASNHESTLQPIFDKPLKTDTNDKLSKPSDEDIRNFALKLIRRHAPKSSDNAVSVDQLSRTVSISRDWLLHLLNHLPGAESINGNVWVRQPWNTDPAPGSKPIGPPHDPPEAVEPETMPHSP